MVIEMIKKRLFIHAVLALLTITAVSCHPEDLWDDAGVTTMHFLPGECLGSYELKCFYPQGKNYRTEADCFTFVFQMNANSTSVEKSVSSYSDPRHLWTEMPDSDLFQRYGANSNAVNRRFEKVYADMRNYWTTKSNTSDALFDFITVFYSGGMSLKADKAFAGQPAGTELTGYLECRPDCSGASTDDPLLIKPFTKSESGSVYGLPIEYKGVLGTIIAFCIPLKEHTLTKDPVTFHLEIPVKKVLYLSWLNDTIDNPNAPVPYEDAILTCDFKSDYNLK